MSTKHGQFRETGNTPVPDHAAVLDADVLERLVDLADLLDTLVEGLLRSAATNQLTTPRVELTTACTPGTGAIKNIMMPKIQNSAMFSKTDFRAI